MDVCDCCFFFFSSRRRHTRCALVTGVQTCALPISMLRDVLARRLQALGPDHLEVARARNDLGAVLRRTGKLEECETLYRQAIATRRAQLGDDHPDVAS